MKIDATKKIPGEGFKRAWPPLIKMDEAVKAKVENFLETLEINPKPSMYGPITSHRKA
jgi:3-polyprenyl-4-hydroxybenzoate decarboxylase